MYLGIDIGTSSVKTVLFDRDQRLIGQRHDHRIEARRQCLQPEPHRGVLAPIGLGVAHDRDRERRDHRFDRIGMVAEHHHQLVRGAIARLAPHLATTPSAL